MAYNCKYIEVSAALNIKMDELLVGLVHQIDLNPERDAKRKKKAIRKLKRGKSNAVRKLARGLLGKIFKNQSNATKSCDNLMVL